jgi:uncharacterized protein (DUF983 family)
MNDGARRVLARGVTRRCPKCGYRKIFRRYFTLVERCPRCNYEFALEEGYWTGAMIMNMAFTEVLFLTLFIGYVILSAPDIDWINLLVIGAATNVVFPIVFYPLSKTIWMAVDLVFMKKLDV